MMRIDACNPVHGTEATVCPLIADLLPAAPNLLEALRQKAWRPLWSLQHMDHLQRRNKQLIEAAVQCAQEARGDASEICKPASQP